jgi:hypothetical protein
VEKFMNMKKKEGVYKIDYSPKKSGIYFCQIKGGKTKLVEKIIVVK